MIAAKKKPRICVLLRVKKTNIANTQNVLTNHCHPRFNGNNATQRGNISKPIAKQIFEKKFDFEVKAVALLKIKNNLFFCMHVRMA